MRRYVLSPHAQGNLECTWNYQARRWDVKQADTYIRLLQSAVETLAVDPQRGRPCDHIRAGYRKYAVDSHVLFYRIVTYGVDVVCILHQRMDFEAYV